ncbi:acyl-CoA dehydrogenase family protein [Streptomyces sp. NPDC005438]|uniref:acyl-CoA dehydrogenase family protein n=1 Tax=Streptomyces sp. NPDC005438 TaxID=3156880 RepID=UPI0033AD5C93
MGAPAAVRPVPAPRTEEDEPAVVRDSEELARVVREVAEDLATDAVPRERAGRPPYDEVARLREAGLLGLLVPREHGGAGADWRAALAAVRQVAAVDAAIGQLLGNHYFLSYGPRFFASPTLATRVERESAAGAWCWGGAYETPGEPLILSPGPEGYLLDGRQCFATGARVADRLAVRARRADSGEPLAVLVDPEHPGVVREAPTDTFGQRLAGGCGVVFDAVPVGLPQVFGSLSADEGVLSPFATLAVPTGLLVSAQLCVGIAEGVLAEVREYRRAVRSPWEGPPSQDPHELSTYGELVVAARSSAALTDQATQGLLEGLALGEDLTDEQAAEIATLAATAEAAATRAAQDVSSRALEVVGACSAASEQGLDRFWRNARTRALHTPTPRRLREVGDHLLNGSHPPFALPC